MEEIKDYIIFYIIIISVAICYSYNIFTEIITFWKADNMLHHKGEIYHFQK